MKVKFRFVNSISKAKRWLDLLTEEDISFIKRLLMCSGSLKELAAAYNVTYPTVRLRLDRLIEKVRAFEAQEITDDYERLLRGLYAEGKLDSSTFRQLIETYRETLNHQKP